MSFSAKVWTTLSSINVNQHSEKKGNLTYLSWAWAWGELMRHYPSSTYEFKESEKGDDGSVTVWCELTVTDGKESLARLMWLPVMDNRNNAVSNPDARKISDTRMRCLVKCIALFGLGFYIYAGEDLPPKESVSENLTNKYAGTVATIKAGIEGDISSAAEAWFELSDEEKGDLWVAPSKGGVFTTKEREIMQSKDFREAYYGSTEEIA